MNLLQYEHREKWKYLILGLYKFPSKFSQYPASKINMNFSREVIIAP